MSVEGNKPFGALRSLIWPIYPSEYRKFVPMLVIFFLISFNYNILRAAKDTLIITAPKSGAEALPFLKVWVMLPMALFMTFVFTRISNRFSREKVFYWMLAIFLGFFLVFAFVLYPLKDSLHPHGFANFLETLCPKGLHGFIALIRNWVFTAFYVMADLWSSIVFTVLFWGFANEVTSVSEAKRFYAIFGVGANVSGIFAGQVSKMLSNTSFLPFLPFGKTAWEQSVLFLNLTILVVGALILFLFRRLNRRVIQKTFFFQNTPRVKMSVRKNFSYLAKSKYLLCIAFIVLTYNLSINLVEVVWKNQLKILHPSPSAFSMYMGDVMTIMGVIATCTSLFISAFLLRRFSWTINALIPPVIMLSTGIFFFGFLLYKDSFLGGLALFLGTTPLLMTVFFGTIQNCMTRASKYTLFDATKELAFIPLSCESRLKGKAAIDGVGSRIGKSGGAMIHQTLLILFSTISAATPAIAVIFLIVTGVWFLSVVSLGKKFQQLTAHPEPSEEMVTKSSFSPSSEPAEEDKIFTTTSS